jgi:hypothetical protein
VRSVAEGIVTEVGAEDFQPRGWVSHELGFALHFPGRVRLLLFFVRCLFER